MRLITIILLTLITSVTHAFFTSGSSCIVKPTVTSCMRGAIDGHSVAQFELGKMYYYGKDAPKNYKYAKTWFTKSAKQGYPEAQYFLGTMYFEGKGVSQDYKEAIQWFAKVAIKGESPEAQYILGTMYFQGKGVPQDFIQAHIWLNISASNSHDKASKLRDKVMSLMTQKQISKAQSLATEYVKKMKEFR